MISLTVKEGQLRDGAKGNSPPLTETPNPFQAGLSLRCL